MSKPPQAASGTPRLRPAVERLHPYVPGEQPRDPAIVKLNTNENPYPPSPRVLEALHALGADKVRKYPDPQCTALREAIARDLAVDPEQVLMANGSDEVLKMFAEAWVDPGETVAYLWPTYSLYPVFVHKTGAREARLPWRTGDCTQEQALWAIPPGVRLLYLTSPNPPVGLPVGIDAIRQAALANPEAVVVVDEAYIAYGGESAIELVREGLPNVAITRTFSKSHSLAGMRVGFAVGPAGLIDGLERVRDSYNLDAASQAAALEAWNDATYTREVVSRVCATRERVRGELLARGFTVEPSAGNFLFARHPKAPEIFRFLRENKVLIRYFDTPELRDGLRITIGTDAEMDRLLAVLAQWAHQGD